MDETPVPFDPEEMTTFDYRGSSSVALKKIKTTNQCSALLSVSICGDKLPPLVVFKAQALNGKVAKEANGYDLRCKYAVGAKGRLSLPREVRLQLILFLPLTSDGTPSKDLFL
jgi:hypothetical protein